MCMHKLICGDPADVSYKDICYNVHAHMLISDNTYMNYKDGVH